LADIALNILSKIYNQVNISKLQKIVLLMKKYKTETSTLVLGDIPEKYRKISQNIQTNWNSQAYILCLLARVIKVINGLTVREEQFICALALYHGYMAEMKTGEGKSLAAAMATVLYAATGRVHVVTVNDYLAKRDFENFMKIFNAFGLKCGYNYRGHTDKSGLYQCNVVYTSSCELIFDYLRDELGNGKKNISSLETAIIDECDFVLIDNATSNFSISTGLTYMPNVKEYALAREICVMLDGAEVKRGLPETPYVLQLETIFHYLYSYEDKSLSLTTAGYDFLAKFFKEDSFILENSRFYQVIVDTLKAKHFYLCNRDYIVEDNRIVLINQESGRAMPDSQVEPGVHTAIERKEGVPASPKSLMAISLSYQTFFAKYQALSGMSGTICSAREEIETLFSTGVLLIPTHKPSCRVDHTDEIFLTCDEKYNHLLSLLRLKEKEQPVLLVAKDEAEAKKIFAMVKDEGIKANLLINGNLTEEAALVKASGISGTITISTNLSGRGTDIILDERSKNAGGLKVICLEHYLSDRVDNQVRGRAARQGEPGDCVFLVSFEDEIWNYADKPVKDKLKNLYNERKHILSYRLQLSNEITKIQERLKYSLFQQRKNIFELDYIVETIRQQVLVWRDALVEKGILGTLEDFQKINWEDLTTKELANQALTKHNSLSSDISGLLFCSLTREVVFKHWLIYQRELHDIKKGLYLRAVCGNNQVTDFIRICAHEMTTFKKLALYDLVSLYVIAEQIM
jgi:preprotein translocase subunit SecA